MNALAPRPGTSIRQFSFVDALVAGLLEGAFDAREVAAAGTLGVGCGDALDGELVIIGDEMLVCRGGGAVEPVAPDARLPFAEVVDFAPTFRFEITEPIGEREFEALVDSLVPSHNLFYALRVDGDFEWVSVREAQRQTMPYPGLADAVKTQRESTIASAAGSLLGFKGPDVFQGLSVADYHLHFIADDRMRGGHSLDFVMRSGVLTMEAYASFTVTLPQVASYLSAELDDISADEAIRRAESS